MSKQMHGLECGEGETSMPKQATSDMSVFETMYNCRAMRRLKSDEVPEELIRG